MKPSAESLPAPRPLIWVAQSWWMDDIFAGIAAVASENGWRLDARMRWQRGVPAGAPEGIDGAIVFTGDCPALEEIVKRLKVPVVDIETYADRYGAPKVISYDEPIGEAAALHLAALDPVKLVLLRPGSVSRITAARLAGFVRAAEKVGLPVVERTLRDFDPRALIADGPVGVFGIGDELAIEAIHRCAVAGVRVPEDMAILGADDNRLICETAPVALSSVNMDFPAKGRAAAELLGRLLRGEPRPAGPVVVPISGIKLRASTALPSTGHEELDRLLRYLRENARRSESLDTLCEECGVPARTAHHLLRTRLGRRPLEVLDGFRLELARRFSKDARLTRDAVARAAGFSSRAAMTRAERAATGTGS